MEFKELWSEFEKKNCDLSKLYNDHIENNVSSRFLLIRSLDTQNLIDVYKIATGENVKAKQEKLYEMVYNSNITIDQLLEYIGTQREALIKSRIEESDHLKEIINDLGIVNCGVRNDKIDDIVKALVRNKSIKSVTELNNEIDNNITPRLKQYILWSYYNQTTNDLIELFFIKNNNVIPTLRKIHDVDFFVKIDGKIVPFDIKITHISDDFFNLYKKGMERTNGLIDDYEINANGITEIEEIKSFYKDNKKAYNLPNIGKQSKKELLENIGKVGNEKTISFLNKITNDRKKMISSIQNDIRPLEWWNYKYQGERLFCNNNRFFIFLAYSDSFSDGRPLKGDIDTIREKVENILNNLKIENIHNIHYHYDKERDLIGDYNTHVLSTLILKNKY